MRKQAKMHGGNRASSGLLIEINYINFLFVYNIICYFLKKITSYCVAWGIE